MKKFDFNSGWLFCKQGSRNQRPVTLPHDAMIHETRSPENPSGSAQAFFSGGSYLYEKRFTVPAEWVEQRVLFQFEGVYKHAHVTINGQDVGGAAYGYIPFFVEADGLLHCDRENIIQVECENRDQPDSRWYSGAGIYRPVWVWTGPKDGIMPESVKISTISHSPARVRVECPQEAKIEILDGGEIVASGEGRVVDLMIPNARLWSAETPHLYRCRVIAGSDSITETFGIRLVEWSSKGLFINGKSVLLRGGCIHHDSGILGAATYDKSEFRRVKKLKEAGYNAIRSSHNPASRALLEACDQLGMYVMDETWDMWYNHKSRYDYAGDFMAHYKSDIKAMVDRDFNHPSVIMYSIGNEVSEPAQENGVKLAREMVDYIHSMDRNRAVTGGFNLVIISRSQKGKGIYDSNEGGRSNDAEKKMSGMSSTMFNIITNIVGTGMNQGANGKKADLATTPVLDALDIAGYNYASGRYPLEGKAHPGRVIFGSETFPQDIGKNWRMVEKYPYLIGDFMWTAWDYLGEAGAGAWAYTPDGKGFEKPFPWLLADMGAFDILGDPNGEAFWAQAVWGLLEKPVIAVQPVNHPGTKPAKSTWRGTNALPGWSWRGCEGNAAVVEVYAAAEIVELQLNGKSLGKKQTKDGRAAFKTRYAPGKLTAIACDKAGREISRSELCSAEGKIRLHIDPEEKNVCAGEIVFVPVSLVGANGIVERACDRELSVSVDGAELLAFGSANPRTAERYDAGRYTTYYGRAQAVIRTVRVGTVTVSVTDGEQTAAAEITVLESGAEDKERENESAI